MSRGRSRFRPPTKPAFKSGLVLTFAEPDKVPDPSEMVELKPAGTPVLMLECKPESERVDVTKSPLPPAEPTSAGSSLIGGETRPENDTAAQPEPGEPTPHAGEPSA